MMLLVFEASFSLSNFTHAYTIEACEFLEVGKWVIKTICTRAPPHSSPKKLASAKLFHSQLELYALCIFFYHRSLLCLSYFLEDARKKSSIGVRAAAFLSLSLLIHAQIRV